VAVLDAGLARRHPEVARYYPTDVLVTGHDIIFFWVARMMMMGLRFKDEAPFHTVYIHALVRDEKGQKMSKSKGNIIDPLDLIDRYGADALRLTLTAMAAQGRDIKLAEGRVEGYRNFITKLWNAARFCEMNRCRAPDGFDPGGVRLPLARWLVGEVARATRATDQALADYRFNEAAGGLYQFVWGSFCDWFLELAKATLTGPDGAAKDEIRAVAGWALDHILVLMHPIIPFVTEELWRTLGDRDVQLIEAPWPAFGPGLEDAAADAELGWVIRLVSDIRSARAELNVPPGAMLPLVHRDAGAPTRARLAAHGEVIGRLARVENATAMDGALPKGSVQIVLDEATFGLPLAGVIDVAAEAQRLTKQIERLAAEIAKLEAKLADAAFIARAPEHVVETQRERRDEAAATRARLAGALAWLAG